MTQTFCKMLPLAKASNARFILVNRRDFAGAAPYTFRERAGLLTVPVIAETKQGLAQAKVLTWARARGLRAARPYCRRVQDHPRPS